MSRSSFERPKAMDPEEGDADDRSPGLTPTTSPFGWTGAMSSVRSVGELQTR
jgi:hypothetical protein